MLFGTAVILLGGVRMYRRTRAWLERVVSAKGEVVAWVEDEDDSGVVYRAVYRYAEIETDLVGGNPSLRVPPTIGETVVIYYDPSDPRNAFIEGSKAAWFLPGCAFVVAAALTAWAIYVRFDLSV